MYVGQSVNLLRRFNSYYNPAYLANPKNAGMPICQALIKHGPSGFALLIIEYTPISFLDSAEKFWISLLNPYYNVLPGGKTSLGYKHTEESKVKMAAKATGRVLSQETRDLISESLKGINNPFLGKTHDDRTIESMRLAKSAGVVYVYDSLGLLLFIFPSASTLADLIGSTHPTILTHMSNGHLFRGGWYFHKEMLNPSDIVSIISKGDPNYLLFLEDIENAKHIRVAIFLFDSRMTYLRSYSGLMACAKDLKISHNTISKSILSGKPYKGYIFLLHRVIKLGVK